MNNKKRYSLREKEILGVCTTAIEDNDITEFLISRTGAKCEKINKCNYKPVKSNLGVQNYALVAQMVVKAVKLMCETIYFGGCFDSLDREKEGIYKCEKYILNDEESKKLDYFKEQFNEFEIKISQITPNSFHLIFEYIDYLTLFEDSWRKGIVTNILWYDLDKRLDFINEVKSICKIVYKDFIENHSKDIKNSFYKNPEFRSKVSGFDGDSNFMINNDLYNLKTKHKSIPSDKDISQSILYYLISRCNNIYYKGTRYAHKRENLIERLYIYNTRYGDKYEIKFNNLSDKQVEDIMEEVYYMYNNVLLMESGSLPY